MEDTSPAREYFVGTIVNKQPDKDGKLDRCYGHVRVNNKIYYFYFIESEKNKHININDIVSGNTFKISLYQNKADIKDTRLRASLVDIVNKQQNITTTEKATYINSVLNSIFESAFSESPIAPDEFEDQVFQLLRLLGIEKLYSYPKANQGGKADGVFSVKNLVVLYDCTLCKDCVGNKDYNKTGQILAYESLLKNDKIDLPAHNKSNIGLDISRILNRQVWVITRTEIDLKEYNRTTIENSTEITTKNVTIQQIIEVLYHRINDKSFDYNKLEQALLNI